MYVVMVTPAGEVKASFWSDVNLPPSRAVRHRARVTLPYPTLAHNSKPLSRHRSLVGREPANQRETVWHRARRARSCQP